MGEKYILFGAGYYATVAISLLGKENIEFIMDNNRDKAGSSVDGIAVYPYCEKKSQCGHYTIVISVSDRYCPQIEEQLKEDGFKNFLTVGRIQSEQTRKKIEGRFDNISVYKKAIGWIKNNSVDGQAIICNTGKRKGYPEVTGYYIPTLIRWGYRELAVNYAEWLIGIQKADGSWYDTDDVSPYIFDTAQILKGLIAVREIYDSREKIDEAIKKGIDWILGCMTDEGRLVTPDTACWGSDDNTCSELIHMYCLSPIADAGRIFGRTDYIEKAEKILKYYKDNYYDKIMNFSLLSHFYAYVMEALIDMGETDMAVEAMAKIADIQKASGAVPAYKNVDWVCSTGLFQFALVWFRIGDTEHGNKAFEYACRLQNESGGWYGSYLSEDNCNEQNDYFPGAEISWAVKYFLDALYYKDVAEFNEQASDFIETISKEDERYTVVRDIVACNGEGIRILDVGCGKGRYIKNLLENFPDNKYAGVDISKNVMKWLDGSCAECKEGTLTCIPYDDNIFAVTYTCEALEHAIDIENAVKEMVRVTKSNGYVVIIDKNKASYGMLEIGDWEQWPDESELRCIMEKYCTSVEVKHGLAYENMLSHDLFSAWIGIVK